MKRDRRFVVLAYLLSIGVISWVAMVPAAPAFSAATTHTKRTPTPNPTATPTPTPTQLPNAGTYVKTYANILNGVQQDVTPEEVSPTSDGGSIALALTTSASSTGVSWLVKLDSSGRPQWQTELGCLNLPPGSYADGVSVQQTTDGGYIVGGGTIGCGSSSSCPPTSGIQCAFVEKVGQGGNLLWAYVYPAGAAGSSIRQIRQTSDGGYVAVGTTTDLNQNTGALILKLDSQGIVQWQRELGPAGSAQGFLNAVQQTPDGGYVATGQFYVPSTGSTPESVLVVKLDAGGTVQWQRGFNNLSSTGTATSTEHTSAILTTPDGGYLVAGAWSNSTFPGECCQGGLLLKLDGNGNIQWQKAYSGGTYCYSNGYSESCTDIGAVIYSAQRTPDGGYILAGDGDLTLQDNVPLVPWLAKVDSSGNLLWQHFYYQTYQPTGRPLSEYFASSTVTPDGGTLALGWTENYSKLKGELYGVKTDSTGSAGTCSDQHPATPLNAIDPALTTFSPSLPVQTTLTPGSTSPSGTLATSIGVQIEC
jgi:hypothetical protein